MKFQGNTLVTLLSPAALSTQNMSLEFWVNASDVSSGSIMYRKSGNGRSWEVLFCNGGKLCFRAGPTVVSTTSAPLSPGQWYYVVATVKFNPSNNTVQVTWYLNGVLDQTTPETSGQLVLLTCSPVSSNSSILATYDAGPGPVAISPLNQGFVMYTNSSSVNVYGTASNTSVSWRVVDNTTSSGYIEYQKPIPASVMTAIRLSGWTVTANIR